jgi:hypothetical protein
VRCQRNLGLDHAPLDVSSVDFESGSGLVKEGEDSENAAVGGTIIVDPGSRARSCRFAPYSRIRDIRTPSAPP